MLRNIIFDMGNVLLDYNPQNIVEHYFSNWEDQELILRELFGGPEWIQGDLGYIKDADRFDSVSRRVPNRLHDGLRSCVLHWHQFMTPIEGALEFTDMVKKAGFHLFILSNASDAFYEYFPRFRPLSFFDGVVVSADLHCIKPDPKIYRYLLETYRLKPEECLFFDDREENVAGAEAVGIHGCMFDGNYQKARKALESYMGI